MTASSKRRTAKAAVLKMPPGVTVTTEDLFAADLTEDQGTVQRYFDPKLAAKLEADWDPLAVGTLTVSRRADGSLWTIDGQHRRQVALRFDPAAVVRCEVYEGLTEELEAQMFRKINKGRKGVPKYDEYCVALTGKERVAIRMQNAVHARGLDFERSPSPNRVAAIDKCWRIVELDKAETGLLALTLEVCEAAWGRKADSWDGVILWGVAQVLDLNRGTIRKDRLIRTLGKQLPFQWKAQANALTKSGGGSLSRSTPLVLLVADAYNKNLRTSSSRIVARRPLRRKVT